MGSSAVFRFRDEIRDLGLHCQWVERLRTGTIEGWLMAYSVTLDLNKRRIFRGLLDCYCYGLFRCNKWHG